MKPENPKRRHITIGPLRPCLPLAQRPATKRQTVHRAACPAALTDALKRLMTTPHLAYWFLRAQLEAVLGKVRSN